VSQLLATNPNTALDHPGAETVAGASTPDPTPTPAPAEVLASLFPSDAGGVEYLFGGNLLDAVPTPLEGPPETHPNEAANAMNATSEGVSVHVSTPPDVPTPVTGGAIDVPLAEQATEAAAPSTKPTLASTISAELARVKRALVAIGGPSGD
jgi:hypothetical protein